jgi:hypothetical protein
MKSLLRHSKFDIPKWGLLAVIPEGGSEANHENQNLL